MTRAASTEADERAKNLRTIASLQSSAAAADAADDDGDDDDPEEANCCAAAIITKHKEFTSTQVAAVFPTPFEAT